jgi:hypothetical protein
VVIIHTSLKEIVGAFSFERIYDQYSTIVVAVIKATVAFFSRLLLAAICSLLSAATTVLTVVSLHQILRIKQS